MSIAMSERNIEDIVRKTLDGEAQRYALEFFSFLAEKGLKFERGKGYWENQFYWLVKDENKCVCFVLLNHPDAPEEQGSSWVVWSDDSGYNWYEDYPLDEPMKEIAWRYVDICGNCGSCGGGKDKVIFGKQFHRVCRTAFRFDDPDENALVFLKKMIELCLLAA